MIGSYLIVGGIVAMVASYVVFISQMLNRAEQRDLAALGECKTSPLPAKAETVVQVSSVLPAHA